MSKPQYAYRIWRVWDHEETGRGPILTSATRPAWKLNRLRNYDSWEAKNLVAKCRLRKHPAPQVDCKCGVYAYPDLLDALRLIDQYCDKSMYALGLVSGYGGLHNDGGYVAHDACLRFAEAKIVALARLGAAYRAGLVADISEKLGIPLLSLDQLEELAASGERVTRRDVRNSNTRYLDEIPPGETVSVSHSALLADRNGKLFLRKDREAWRRERGFGRERLSVTPEPDGRFHVTHFKCPCHVDGHAFLLLPFDGEIALSNQPSYLAGRVSSIDLRAADPQFAWKAHAEGPGAIELPSEHKQLLLDLVNLGERVELSPPSIDFDQSGAAWLRRTLFPGHWEGFPSFFLTRLDEVTYSLEVKLAADSNMIASVSPIPERVRTFIHDTQIARLVVNGMSLQDGVIPRPWIRGGSVRLPDRDLFA